MAGLVPYDPYDLQFISILEMAAIEMQAMRKLQFWPAGFPHFSRESLAPPGVPRLPMNLLRRQGFRHGSASKQNSTLDGPELQTAWRDFVGIH